MDILIQKESCYKELLREVTLLLGFIEPLYSTLNATSNVACVVIRASKGSSPYFRVGRACVDPLEYDESSANDCLRILVTIFCLYVWHIAKAKGEQCDELDINMTFSLANGCVAGRGGLEDDKEICIHACEDEYTTPTDPAYQLVCSSIPHPLKKVEYFGIMEYIYPTVCSTCADPETFTERAILTPRNEDVDLINALLIEIFCGDECSYKSFDTIIDDDYKMDPIEFLNTLLI